MKAFYLSRVDAVCPKQNTLLHNPRVGEIVFLGSLFFLSLAQLKLLSLNNTVTMPATKKISLSLSQHPSLPTLTMCTMQQVLDAVNPSSNPRSVKLFHLQLLKHFLFFLQLVERKGRVSKACGAWKSDPGTLERPNFTSFTKWQVGARQSDLVRAKTVHHMP